MMKTLRRLGAVLLAACLAAAVLGLCSGTAGAAPKRPFESLEGMKRFFVNRRVGILDGSIFGDVCRKTFPRAKQMRYENVDALVKALKAGEIEGFLTDQPAGFQIAAAHKELWIPEVMVRKDRYAFALARENAKLTKEINKTIQKLKENGTLARLQAKWLKPSQAAPAMPDILLSGRKGKIRVASDGDSAPMAFLKDGKLAGYEIELLMYVAQECGYALETEILNFKDVLPAVSSGRCDVAADCLSIASSRAKQIRFSTPILDGGVVMVLHGSLR